MSAESNSCDQGESDTFPQVDFPYKFYDFMREASVSHPHVVAWSDCGGSFRVDRHSPQLPSLLRKHFKHSKYESLRRQMNSYGFFINKATDWWSLKSGYFSRDHPQLNKILPRPRSTRPIKVQLPDTANVSAEKFPPRDESRSPPSDTADESLINRPKNSVRSSSVPKSLPMTSDVKKKPSVDMESRPARKVSKRALDAVSKKEAAAAKKSRNRIPHGTFPELLHQFVCECSLSNPDVVRWNSNRTAFNVEVHHPALPNLLSKYFQHGNYQSLRRQLNFYGFRRDAEGYYRNNNFYYGHFDEVTNGNLKSRSSTKAQSNTRLIKEAADSNTRYVKEEFDEFGTDDSDALSPLFDNDLSTYATMRTDELSFERMDDQELQDKSSVDGRALDNTADEKETEAPKFNVLQKVYVCDKDGVMYLATIRRQLYGPHYQKQIDMGLVVSKEEAYALVAGEDNESSWHYFVHYDSWNVNFDRWVSEHDVHPASKDVIAVAERISKEHRSLQVEMRKNVKGKKLFQTIEGTAFLREWKKRLNRILYETKFGNYQSISNDKLKETIQEADEKLDQPSMKNKKIAWTQAAITNEKIFREQGLTTARTQTNTIVLPFVLKKVLVQQWEYINQCRMMPCIPASVTIRQALNIYLESKNVALSPSESSTLELREKTDLIPQAISQNAGKSSERCNMSEKDDSHPNEALRAEDRGQEWRDMADGISMLFDEALESRLLYREELPQLLSIDNIPEYSRTPYSELYGCEHLLRLFVRLPEMLSDNLPDEEVRPIVAKVNDFIRFLHKNQGTLLTQTHRKLNEAELKEQVKLNLDSK